MERREYELLCPDCGAEVDIKGNSPMVDHSDDYLGCSRCKWRGNINTASRIPL